MCCSIRALSPWAGLNPIPALLSQTLWGQKGDYDIGLAWHSACLLLICKRRTFFLHRVGGILTGLSCFLFQNALSWRTQARFKCVHLWYLTQEDLTFPHLPHPPPLPGCPQGPLLAVPLLHAMSQPDVPSGL